jgi:hypothetical protein
VRTLSSQCPLHAGSQTSTLLKETEAQVESHNRNHSRAIFRCKRRTIIVTSTTRCGVKMRSCWLVGRIDKILTNNFGPAPKEVWRKLSEEEQDTSLNVIKTQTS